MVNSIVLCLEVGHGTRERVGEVVLHPQTRNLVVIGNRAFLVNGASGGVNDREPSVVGGFLRPVEHTVVAERHGLELVVDGKVVALADLCGLASVLVNLEEIAVLRHGVEVAVLVGGKGHERVVHLPVVTVAGLQLAGVAHMGEVAGGKVNDVET